MSKRQIYTLVGVVILACSVIGSGYSADTVTPISKIKLGERLFHDKHLSADGTISCATCHVPEQAFTDGLRVAKGINGQLGTRNTPTLLNVNYATSLFWDGRRATLEDQAQDPFINPREHGLKDHAAIVKAVQADPDYQSAFKQAFGASPPVITLTRITQAIAAFERSLIAVDAPYDDYVRTHDAHVISESARRGLDLFQGRARCASCHLMEAPVATFTDNQFHSLGIGYRKIEPRLAEITTHLANSRGQLLDHQIISDAEISELGRFTVTLNPQDIAKFRTPSLRNVALTAPYMHDGSVATLEDAVDMEVYYRGVELNRPLILTPQEHADLIAFLRTLTSPHARSM